ncbi:hypothetical protein [Pinibacter soli]|uniref:Uncharacterized protein n=1 Tax=Pinibacter soli TaxID=3044211 RepID=A0ABT6R894_9BACT|nr:hypothetical protein [Pinibacter soli]MDI3318772.1 hypothetical protein [Pinibacter soli]
MAEAISYESLPEIASAARYCTDFGCLMQTFFLLRPRNDDATFIVEGHRDTTIEQYFMLKKIEEVKELLVCNELALSGIAFKLATAVLHIICAIQKTIGFTPDPFRQLLVNANQ